MARILNDEALPFRFATPAIPAGDDEIGLHVEALEDGREPIGLELGEERDLLPDDEIDAHLEAGELLFAPLRVRQARRRATRH